MHFIVLFVLTLLPILCHIQMTQMVNTVNSFTGEKMEAQKHHTSCLDFWLVIGLILKSRLA